MTEFLIAELTDTSVPLNLTIDQEGVGGVTGKSPTVRIRNASTTNSYLDWADNTFKTSGWTTLDGAMTEIGRGHYQRTMNVSLVALAAGTVVAAEYNVNDGGSVIGDDHDLIRLVVSIDDIPGDVSGGGTGGTVVVEGELYRFNHWAQEITLPNSGTQAQRLVTFDAETLAFGKVYIESNLTVLYVKFGNSDVDADNSLSSIRLVGGAPWTIATSGHTHMSIYAAADISVRVRGLIPV